MDKLNQKREALYQAYLEASQDSQREEGLKDWDILGIEFWKRED